jgi:hypothetical protein
MEVMTFEETIKNDAQKANKWLLENKLLDNEGRIYHSIFFKTEEDSKNALKFLISKDYYDSYIDVMEGDDYPFWIDFMKTIPLLNESNIILEVNHVMSLLSDYDFDYNNFAILADITEDESLFFNPSL